MKAFALVAVLMLMAGAALAHGVAPGDKGYIQTISGVHLLPFVYLGAKHMVTGYDHVLFLLAVVFFLYRLRDVGIYVSLFALGHLITLVGGVLGNVAINAHLIDAVIGLSVAWKALDNLGLFRRLLGHQPDNRLPTLIFGLFHGLGLATRVISYDMSPDGLLPNLLAFSLGVEIGQLLALSAIFLFLLWMRRLPGFPAFSFASNVVILTAGFILAGYQVTGWWVT